ncbi:helix-turn-helix transcriptional regulator [Jatrophihabitans endophyticus]|uniref:ArsR/SmtB family transcription factor n=1 Tax=Jatrophihabitans endophyticus TaxID=1206085 RepID=UPI0019FC6D84|nr:metalloregulator ArsR/SmtB family transcription factor [Jatrophihabitans endophyticus]MBE7188762.1 winged helix-turn-helix transcriptional regulator [Jatrophihabitans endophyticus]
MPEFGDVDLSAIGAVLADDARCRMLLALDDGRALPAGRLAAEAGVAASTASGHLRRLLDAGLVAVETHGRHRYYRLSGPEVGRLLETLHHFAPRRPVRSLRQGTRAAALRDARTCYDHLAGRLGVAVMAALLDRGHLEGGDGRYDPASGDARAGFGRQVDYALTPAGHEFLDGFGVRVTPRRPAVRYCVDWTEQRHHLSGAVGRGLLDRLLELDWVRRAEAQRAVDVTPAGRQGLGELLGIEQTVFTRPEPAANMATRGPAEG